MAGREKTAAEKAWQSAYDKEHFRDFTLRLRKDADAALIEKMGSVPNKNRYLRDLIRADVAGAEDEPEKRFIVVENYPTGEWDTYVFHTLGTANAKAEELICHNRLNKVDADIEVGIVTIPKFTSGSPVDL